MLPTDEELYHKYLLGDVEVIDDLLIRHKEGLTWFLYGVVHNMEDAEDLMMDTFALLLAKRVKFHQKSSFKTWLYGIGRMLARNYLRKHSRNSMVVLEDEQISSNLVELEMDFLVKERNRKLMLTMKQLKPEYAEVLYLSFFEQMSTSEIAKVMKCSIKQVYNMTERAKKQLKELADDNLSIGSGS